jgi:hypothetical protein
VSRVRLRRWRFFHGNLEPAQIKLGGSTAFAALGAPIAGNVEALVLLGVVDAGTFRLNVLLRKVMLALDD